ncbi:EAL and HDOD domain-containing protein [Jidongwangia harbinensis]|uniref:EAL and HDOD domain-containing protein n=1 Tax=Jidongwangia harbinensis TaxID=2878561 RepID=UPI001CD987E0|nr:HDOD domain-containing protein [Jidongwangia harbinensis]MCA2214374.1 HDOD domain-containing protein [Jidongwangia harbinensis]
MPRDGDQAPLIHVGRQAIYDRSGDVVAYELLFRDAAGATRATRRSAEATSRVMVAAFTEFGLEQLVDTRACFINVTREFLVGDLPVPFDSNQAVLEIVETVQVDDAVVAGVTGLIERGFTIALDDYQPGAHDRLLYLATYVKIDVLDADVAEVAAVVRRVRADHPHVQLVAERLETEDDLQRAFRLGFDFFQGHVLGRPHVLSTATLSPARLSRVRLLTALSVADVDFDEVVEHIAGDPALTYRLLQATNSAASGLSVRVSSVREAAVLLGLDTVRQWVTLMLLSDLAEASDDQLATVMTRARMCQTAAEQVRLSGASAFSAGLLSGVADLLGRAPAELAGELPLSADVTAALADGSGKLGGLLTAVRRYEQGEPSALAELLEPGEAVKAYLQAVGWCNGVMNAARPPGPARDPVAPRG